MQGRSCSMRAPLQTLLLLAALILGTVTAGCAQRQQGDDSVAGDAPAHGISGVNAFGNFSSAWNETLLSDTFSAGGHRVARANADGVWAEPVRGESSTIYLRAERRDAERWQLVYVVTFAEYRRVDSSTSAHDVWAGIEPDFMRTLREVEASTGWNSTGTTWFPLVHRI